MTTDGTVRADLARHVPTKPDGPSQFQGIFGGSDAAVPGSAC